MKLEEHPTVMEMARRAQIQHDTASPAPAVTREELLALAFEAGADDAGLVSLSRPEVADQRREILELLPGARSLVSYVVRMNRESLRTPARSVANLEFHHTGEQVDEVGSRLAAALEARGVRALNPAMGFPMEADRWPGRMWPVSHKPVAEAAGLGKMGIHRNLIHPRFGNFILLGTVVTDLELEPATDGRPLEFNPCLECKLCVAACPTGAIGTDGSFNFQACYTHNYREFMGGFSRWVETVADSRSARDYRARVRDAETVSMWQSLGFGPNYKAAYCLSVCPAGEEVIQPFLERPKEHMQRVVKPLQAKEESIYVIPGSDAEEHVKRRFPHKEVRTVASSLRPASIRGFLAGLPLIFQPGQSRGLDATYHLSFRGEEEVTATVRIRDGELKVAAGLEGVSDFHLKADSRTWLRFLAKEVPLVWALLTGRLRFRGSPRLLLAFGRCFPG